MAMFAIVPGKPVPAHVLVLGVETWLYVVQHISPITQLQPCLLVRGVSVAGFSAVQALNVSSRVLVLAMVNMSLRGSGAPVPRIFSLKKAVLLVPSVMSVIFTLLR